MKLTTYTLDHPKLEKPLIVINSNQDVAVNSFLSYFKSKGIFANRAQVMPWMGKGNLVITNKLTTYFVPFLSIERKLMKDYKEVVKVDKCFTCNSSLNH